jgi:hypothetical protein
VYGFTNIWIRSDPGKTVVSVFPPGDVTGDSVSERSPKAGTTRYQGVMDLSSSESGFYLIATVYGQVRTLGSVLAFSGYTGLSGFCAFIVIHIIHCKCP